MMLRKHTNVKLRKGRKIEILVPVLAVGVLGFLSIMALCPGSRSHSNVLGLFGGELVHALEVESESGSGEVGRLSRAALTPTVSLTMVDKLAGEIVPGSSGEGGESGGLLELSTELEVVAANASSYSISLYGSAMQNKEVGSTIPSITNDYSVSDFPMNAWGYSLVKESGNGGGSSGGMNTTYHPVPSTNTSIVEESTNGEHEANDSYSLSFLMKADDTIATGTYTSTVVVSVVASPVLVTYTLAYDSNGGANGPSNQAERVVMGSSYTFTIPYTAPVRGGFQFLGWADAIENANSGIVNYAMGSTVTLQANGDTAKTIYAVWQRLYSYSLAYDMNGGTGSIATQTQNNTANTSHTFTVSSTQPTRTGYAFQGWNSTKTGADSGTVEYTVGNTITLQSSEPNKTIYAVWKEKTTLNHISTMQQLTPTVCQDSEIGETKQLNDERAASNKDTSSLNKYWVAKLADGNCWMTQNLDYAASTPASTSSVGSGTTDTGKVWDDGLKVISTTNFSGSATSVAGKTASTDSTFVGPVSGNIYNAHYLTGNYYQYSAALTACPSGWQLPTSNSTTEKGSFGYLLTTLGGITSNATGAAKLPVSPYYFVPAGSANPYSGIMSSVGTNGFYWSSTPGGTPYAYLLYFNSSSVSPSNNFSRYGGYSVRCLVNGN